jgi:hypothetical protein
MAMLVHLFDAQQAVTQRFGAAAQLGQRARLDHQVRVDEGQPRAVRVGHALVVGGGEAGIVRVADEAHAGSWLACRCTMSRVPSSEPLSITRISATSCAWRRRERQASMVLPLW